MVVLAAIILALIDGVVAAPRLNVLFAIFDDLRPQSVQKSTLFRHPPQLHLCSSTSHSQGNSASICFAHLLTRSYLF